MCYFFTDGLQFEIYTLNFVFLISFFIDLINRDSRASVKLLILYFLNIFRNHFEYS